VGPMLPFTSILSRSVRSVKQRTAQAKPDFQTHHHFRV
jgi:hypothetical protein